MTLDVHVEWVGSEPDIVFAFAPHVTSLRRAIPATKKGAALLLRLRDYRYAFIAVSAIVDKDRIGKRWMAPRGRRMTQALVDASDVL